MQKIKWLLLAALIALWGACTTPITHPVAMGYSGQAGLAVQKPVTVGIQAFGDQRDEADRYVVSYRQLGRGEQERYVSSPDDIARSVTRMTGELIRQKGGVPDVLRHWDYSPEQLLLRPAAPILDPRASIKPADPSRSHTRPHHPRTPQPAFPAP